MARASHDSRVRRNAHMPAEPRTDTSAGRNVRRPGGQTILLVDDDFAVRESVRRVLAGEGWQVVTAGTGEEALELLQEREPDLMITDLRMAAVSGWDLLYHERLQRPHLPIFVITALSAQAASEAAGFATEFFEKPLDFEHLLAAIHRCLRAPLTARPHV